MSKFTYEISKPARLDIRNVFSYSIDNFGVIQAVKYKSDLESHIRKISSHENFIMIKKYQYDGGQFLFSRIGRHNIYFRYEGNHTLIVRVLHDQMQPELHL